MLTKIASRTILVDELAAELERPGPSLIVLRARTADDPWQIVGAALASGRRTGEEVDLSWTALEIGARLQSEAMAASLQAEVNRALGPEAARDTDPPRPTGTARTNTAGARATARGTDAPRTPDAEHFGAETTGAGPFAPAARALTSRTPVRLTLYGADQLLQDSETARNLGALWSLARASALPLHLILVVEDREAEARALAALEPHEGDATRLHLPPLSLRDLAGALPGWNSDRIVSGRALLGGDAAVWSRVDPRATLSTNVCRLILSPEGPFFDRGWKRLAIGLQKPERYAQVLHAVAAGARDWGGIVASSPAFTSASQLGPYMRQLESDGQVSAERSLDAGPRSRRTRYRIVDSHQAFWFRHLLPLRSRLLSGSDPREIWRTDIRPRVRSFVAGQVPALLQSEIALESVLGVRAREVGALWNDGCDFPVAGTLETGAAFYGRTWWADTPATGVLDQMRMEMRETRYGFGRESRWRLLFVRLDPDHNWERQVARTPDARFIGVDDVVGRSTASGTRTGVGG